MPVESDQPWREMPDHWLAVIYQYVTGFQNVTGKEFSEPIIKPALIHIYPMFIVQYGLLTLLGISSNVYLIYYIMRYKLYRDVTHAFLMNLALCHFVQSGIVLPITLMVIIVQNWIYGQFLCFFLPLLQDIPLHVAIISHLLIAWDRMRWLGDPLKARLPSFVCSCATWLTGMVIALPYPIYTTYLDLGLYLPKFRGVGICVVNLVDDMQEYMRGLFVIMYCAPSTLLAYLYIRTSRELRPPEGPLGVMMFEHRADVRNRQRTSSNTPSATRTGTRTNYARSYDLYDAELDVTREKRTQRYLGAMAATQVVCICPLMILRIARMVLVETYENTKHFDITYLMFVWIAFLPTFLNPCIYASWVLSRPMKERLRGYFRLSSRPNDKKSGTQQRSSDASVTQENTTVTCDEPVSPKPIEKPLKQQASAVETVKPITATRSKITTISDTRPISKSRHAGEFSGSLKERLAVAGLIDRSGSVDPLTNSCSNITASTYCNGNPSVETVYYEKNPLSDSLFSVGIDAKSNRSLLHAQRYSQDGLSDLEHVISRRESSSTYERDMDIIDLLERERSMDIQDMLERERRGDKMRSISRQGSSVERHHRKLPDITRLSATPGSPKRGGESNFPNLVFTHQLSESGAGAGTVVAGIVASHPVRTLVSGRPSSQAFYASTTKRDSTHSHASSLGGRDDLNMVLEPRPIRSSVRENRLGRTRSNGSATSMHRSSSIKSRDRRIMSGEYREPLYSPSPNL